MRTSHTVGHGRQAKGIGACRVPPVSRRALLRGALGAITLAGGAATMGCGGRRQDSSAGSSGASRRPGEVTIALDASSEPAAGFDPLIAWGCGEHVHEPLIQSTLITTDAHLGFEGDLATEWSCSSDGLVWTFKIRDDAVFSDGTPLSSRDVVYTVSKIATSSVAEADLSMIERAEAKSDTVVELHLSRPYNALLYTLAVVGIVSERGYGAGYGKHPIGSGRYLLERWDRGQQAIFRANRRYYGAAPTIRRFVVVFTGEDAALAAAQAGEVDVAFTSATHAAQRCDGYELASYPTVDSRGISLPCVRSGGTRCDEHGRALSAGNDVTCDVAVRRAISYAIDRDAVVEHVLNGHGHPAYSVSDRMPWYSEDMRVDTDIAAAEALLGDAGWAVGSDGIRARAGVRAAFDLWYSSDDSVRQAIAHEVADQLHALGIAVSPRGGSWDEITARQYADPVLWGWGSNAPIELLELNRSDSFANYAGWASAAIDRHLDEALAEPDIEASNARWKAAQWDGSEGFAPKGAASWAWIANVDHLYFKRRGLSIAKQKLHPHGHGWSLLNNIDRWRWAVS